MICNVLASVVSNTSDYFIITTRRRALHLLILSGDQGALVALIAPTASLLPPLFLRRRLSTTTIAEAESFSSDRSFSPSVRTSVFSHGRAHPAVHTVLSCTFFAPVVHLLWILLERSPFVTSSWRRLEISGSRRMLELFEKNLSTRPCLLRLLSSNGTQAVISPIGLRFS